MVPQEELNGTTTIPQVEPNPPRVLEPADEADVMRDQLEYLIGHANAQGTCDCPDCQRYFRVRSILLEIFSEPQRQQVRQITALPMAA